MFTERARDRAATIRTKSRGAGLSRYVPASLPVSPGAHSFSDRRGVRIVAIYTEKRNSLGCSVNGNATSTYQERVGNGVVIRAYARQPKQTDDDCSPVRFIERFDYRQVFVRARCFSASPRSTNLGTKTERGGGTRYASQTETLFCSAGTKEEEEERLVHRDPRENRRREIEAEKEPRTDRSSAPTNVRRASRRNLSSCVCRTGCCCTSRISLTGVSFVGRATTPDHSIRKAQTRDR